MITVAADKRYLKIDGEFFPYLADTAWTLLQRLTRQEIVYYLDVRKKQGFNAVQVSAISELDGINTPNAEGNFPFKNGDVFKPDSNYFDMLLFLIGECEKRNMVLTLLPTWGDKFNKKWGIGPEIFTPENAEYYGEYLASLIDRHENIIFMLGGDRPIENANHRTIIDSMAKGLKKGEKVKHLVTYHPCGEATSLDFLKNCDYIDFHSIQSGHSFGGFSSEKMIEDVLKRENKPCLDAELFYEDFPIDFNTDFGYRFTPEDIRERVYKNMFAGSLGTVYGHQSVWCFKRECDSEYIFDWKTALSRPMANEIGNIKAFLKKVDITTLTEYNECYNAKALADQKTMVILMLDKKNAFVRFLDRKILSSEYFDIVNGEFIETNIKCFNNSAIIPPYKNEAVLIIRFE